jgi:hypothetical protein
VAHQHAGVHLSQAPFNMDDADGDATIANAADAISDDTTITHKYLRQ